MTSGQTRDLMEAVALARQSAADLVKLESILSAMAASITAMTDRISTLEVRRGPGRPRKHG